jgi:hypothetical protein
VPRDWIAGTEAYITKEVRFKFRGRVFDFALSQGLFSSADIDTGTRMLLRVFSERLDADRSAGLPPPRRILDAGCGIGVIGICVLGALLEAGTPAGGPPESRSPAGAEIRLHARDRDELARLFTEYNARKNGIAPSMLEVRTGKLLEERPDSPWDLILSNVPAKAGNPVLLDFIARSAVRLSPGGRALLVAVNPLADMFRSRIGELCLPVFHDEQGGGHTVFMYGPGTSPSSEAGPGDPEAHLPDLRSVYFRSGGDYELEGIPYHIDAVRGTGGFDDPGDAVRCGVKLVSRLGSGLRGSPKAGGGQTLPGETGPAAVRGSVLIHEPGQGHFPVWLWRHALGMPEPGDLTGAQWVLSGRNILALEAAGDNLGQPGPGPDRAIVPAPDILTGAGALRKTLGQGEEGFGFIAVFPGPDPRARRIDALWEGLGELAKHGGINLVVLPSSEAERFDRKKPRGFIRLGDLKRRGFRALAYLQGASRP